MNFDYPAYGPLPNKTITTLPDPGLHLVPRTPLVTRVGGSSASFISHALEPPTRVGGSSASFISPRSGIFGWM